MSTTKHPQSLFGDPPPPEAAEIFKPLSEYTPAELEAENERRAEEARKTQARQLSLLAEASRTWSEQQTSIFDWFRSGTGNLVVRARAGTGKTTTICEGINHAPEDSIMLAAFNKRIATELTKKLKNPNAEAKTLHSIGYGFVLQNWKGAKTDNDRGWRMAAAALRSMTHGNVDAPKTIIQLVAKLATLGKEINPFAKKHPIPADPNRTENPDGVEGDLTDIQYNFDCLPEDEWAAHYTAETIEIAALKAMELATIKETGEFANTIDFADMIYLPLRMGWVRGKWKLVCIDEGQDMNAAQLLLAVGSCKKGGRIAIIGDDKQAIYGFRGADSGAIDRMKAELEAVELGLTTTYRCPKKVVALAQRIVPDFHAAPSAPEGIIEVIPHTNVPKHVKPGDFVLSRTNAPLVQTCLGILRAGIRAKIEGKDIGKGMVALVKKLKPKSIPHFLERLRKWEKDMVARAIASNKEARADQIRDQAETLVFLAEGMKGVYELEKRIFDLFDDAMGTPVVVCSTVHRAKGLESNRVFILRDTLARRSFGGAAAKPVSNEERNIEYVAITRSKAELIWVDGPPK